DLAGILAARSPPAKGFSGGLSISSYNDPVRRNDEAAAQPGRRVQPQSAISRASVSRTDRGFRPRQPARLHAPFLRGDYPLVEEAAVRRGVARGRGQGADAATAQIDDARADRRRS